MGSSTPAMEGVQVWCPARWTPLLILLAACDQPEARARAAVAVPDTLSAAASRYEDRCAGCHGSALQGTEFGPPLIALAQLPEAMAVRRLEEVFRRGIARHTGTVWKVQGMLPKPDLIPEAPGLAAYLHWLVRTAR